MAGLEIGVQQDDTIRCIGNAAVGMAFVPAARFFPDHAFFRDDRCPASGSMLIKRYLLAVCTPVVSSSFQEKKPSGGFRRRLLGWRGGGWRMSGNSGKDRSAIGEGFGKNGPSTRCILRPICRRALSFWDGTAKGRGVRRLVWDRPCRRRLRRADSRSRLRRTSYRVRR